MFPLNSNMDVTVSGAGCPRCGCKEFLLAPKNQLTFFDFHLILSMWQAHAPLSGTYRLVKTCKHCGYKENTIIAS